MNVNREEIYAALFAFLTSLKTAGTLATASRRLKHIDELVAQEFPAGYQVQGNENANSRPNLPTIWTLNAEWWMYAYQGDPNLPSTPILNPILDAVTNALNPESPLKLQTLGARVFNAQLNGTIEVVEGVLGDRALAIVPIKITKAD